MSDQSPGEVIALLATIEEYAPCSPTSSAASWRAGRSRRKFVDGLVEDADAYLAAGERAGTVRAGRDPHGRARALVATQVGLLVMAQLDGARGARHRPDGQPAAAIEGGLRRHAARRPGALHARTVHRRAYLDAYRESSEGTGES